MITLAAIHLVGCVDLATDILNKVSKWNDPCADKWEEFRRSQGLPNSQELYAAYQRCGQSFAEVADKRKALGLKDRKKIQLGVSAHLCVDLERFTAAQKARSLLPRHVDWSKNDDVNMRVHDANSELSDSRLHLKYARADQRRHGVVPLSCSDGRIQALIACFREVRDEGKFSAQCSTLEVLSVIELFTDATIIAPSDTALEGSGTDR